MIVLLLSTVIWAMPPTFIKVCPQTGPRHSCIVDGDTLWLEEGGVPEEHWLARKPRMLVAITLANRMARAIWAMLSRQEDYRKPAVMA